MPLSNPFTRISGPNLSPAQLAFNAEREAAQRAAGAAGMRGHNRLVNVGKLATAAGFGSGTLAGIFGGGAAAGAGGAGGYSSPGVFSGLFGGGGAATAPAAMTAGKFTLGSLLKHPLTALAGQGITNWLGQRSANNANQYAVDVNARLTKQQMDMEAERLRLADEAEKQDRIDAERRWQAEEAYRQKMLAASEDERAYTRRLSEEREGRRAKFGMTDREMRTLGQMLGMG